MKSGVGIVIALLAIIGGFLIGWSVKSKEEVRVFNLIEVYKSFDLKKELEGKLRVQLEPLNKMADSLFVMKNAVEMDVEITTEEKQKLISILSQKYELTQQELVRMEQDKIAEYDEQINTQLKAYIEDYTKVNGIDLLLVDDSGEGFFSADPERIDVTDELIGFVNRSYAGS